MKSSWLQTWGRYGAAVLAGLCLALAFPKPGLAGFAWLAPAFFVAAASGTHGRETFRIGYVAGLTHYLTSLAWLLHIPVRGYPILGWISLSAFLALFPAAWVWLVSKVRSPEGSNSWVDRSIWALGGAAAWVAMEMILGRVFGGFPWNLLGTSQYKLLPLIQLASATGVYGVSFVVAWCSLELFCAARETLRRASSRNAWVGEMLLPAAALAVVFGFGLRALREPPGDAESLRVTFIQPSIPQKLIWDLRENTNRFRQLLELSAEALTNETDLLLWPEAAVPDMVRYDDTTRKTISGLARSNGLWLIIGSDDAALRPGGTSPQDVDYFNASFLINPGGEIAASYRKNHLVMFGEFIPLAHWLPFVKWLTPITGGFTPGTKPIPFVLKHRTKTRRGADTNAPPTEPETGAPAAALELGAQIKTATLICFEDVFPHLVRHYVEADTDFLVNLTNDGWFGESSAQWQHAANAVFRAVENGVPLLRCCNNGLTCVVDGRGRIREVLRDAKGRIYGPGILNASIRFRSAVSKAPATFYNQRGDWFGWGCVGLTGWLVVMQLRRVKPLAAGLTQEDA